MNEADSSPINLDELRMLPDWLREDAPPASKQYAAHDYPLGDEGAGRRGDRRMGGQGGFGGRSGDRRGAGGPPDRRRDAGRSGPPPRGGDRRGPREDRRGPAAPSPAPALPAPVKIEFLPDERCLSSINKQIRTTHLAYPLFGLARMFLQEPARHFVQISVLPEAPTGTTLYQLGDDGIVTLDRAILEKQAFDSAKDQFYAEETVQKEPLKGNFINVARERLSGVLLGPTNHHAYQPALRSLYDTRYSRRMSFDDFRRNVEVSTDPVLIEKWKEEARTSTTIRTRVPEGQDPVTLNTPADARAHFRQHHLESLVHGGHSFRLHGSVARNLPEPAMMQAIREAHEREMRYPAQFVQLLRQGLQNSGLHIFKHRKRVVYVSLARPTLFVAKGSVAPGVTAILSVIGQFPLCTRKALAEKVLGQYMTAQPAASQGEVAAMPAADSASVTVENVSPPPVQAPGEPAKHAEVPIEPAAETPLAGPDSQSTPPVQTADTAPAPEPTTPEPVPPVPTPDSHDDPAAKAKAALAADLRFLVQSGHIIEFHNGTFDLPLPPKSKEDAHPTTHHNRSQSRSNQSVTSPHDAPPGTAPDQSAENSDEATSPSALESPAEKPRGESDSTVVEQAETPVAEPTSQSHEFISTDQDGDTITVDPEPACPASENPLRDDKVDHDGLISGAGAAPLDLPLPGDTEDTPNARM